MRAPLRDVRYAWLRPGLWGATEQRNFVERSCAWKAAWGWLRLALTAQLTPAQSRGEAFAALEKNINHPGSAANAATN